jgi:AraC-like DNA-binding protein
VIISQIELLLNYANRFYKRQFITRKVVSNDLLQKLEGILDEYFNNETSLTRGIPTVHYLSEKLNISPSYLSDMLRSLTGQNAQQHIHTKLIQKAKEKLSTTALSVSEVAYELGFEYPQSFSKLFKTKTKLSPLEFRKSFN